MKMILVGAPVKVHHGRCDGIGVTPAEHLGGQTSAIEVLTALQMKVDLHAGLAYETEVELLAASSSPFHH